MPVNLTKQTPDEWLLERFDEMGRRLKGSYIRPMFQLLPDHAGPDCSEFTVRCSAWIGEARWPEPMHYADLRQTRFAYPATPSEAFVHMQELENAA